MSSFVHVYENCYINNKNKLNVLEIHNVDFVKNPHGTMLKICQFLEVECPWFIGAKRYFQMLKKELNSIDFLTSILLTVISKSTFGL